MTDRISGIHHITAIARSPQRNLEFYAGLLGLSLVKRTVNFDDPYTYHLYYGDETGSPGTIVTFFPWANVTRGRPGTGQVAVTSFEVPAGSFGFWMRRFAVRGVTASRPFERLGDLVLSFQDPDGLELELVESPRPDGAGSGPDVGSAAGREPEGTDAGPDSEIPAEFAVCGLYGATLVTEGYERTAGLLTDLMGLRLSEEADGRVRFTAVDGGRGARLDLVCAPSSRYGTLGAGTVHHIAFRTPDRDRQTEWRELLASRGFDVTPVKDRKYFSSIYFREPGGVLFEIATDGPGFTVDEPREALGTGLMLPPWLEPYRERLEGVLPALTAPHAA